MKASGMAKEAGHRLYMHEIVELAVMHEGIYDLITSAFDLGYYRGVSAEKYRRRKQKK